MSAASDEGVVKSKLAFFVPDTPHQRSGASSEGRLGSGNPLNSAWRQARTVREWWKSKDKRVILVIFPSLEDYVSDNSEDEALGILPREVWWQSGPDEEAPEDFLKADRGRGVNLENTWPKREQQVTGLAAHLTGTGGMANRRGR